MLSNKVYDIIKSMISESINELITEYHHAYDNGLYQEAIKICDDIVTNYQKGWNGRRPISYTLDSMRVQDEAPFKLYVSLTDSEVSQFEAWSIIKISKKKVEEAIRTNDRQALLSIIYHELGHMVNLRKSNSLSQIRHDMRVPLFLKLDTDEYNRYSKILYRFNKNEMKARCFETTMFLKQNKDRNITINDVYDNRCSDITMMRNFLNYLYDCSQNNNINNHDAYIIKELYYSIFDKKSFNKTQFTVQQQAGKLYKILSGKFIWFKKRIDKIFTDYKTSSDIENDMGTTVK